MLEIREFISVTWSSAGILANNVFIMPKHDYSYYAIGGQGRFG